MNSINFDQLGLSEPILRSLKAMGFEAPTGIQEQCIPSIIEGRDLVGQAQTGTGKTAAFGIPLLESIDFKDYGIQALIQCPTRELAIQVTGELMKIGQFLPHLHVVPVYGGQPIGRQLTALKRGAQIVVGTPGRTIDHIKRGTIKLDSLKMLIFDEADEMLNMGFREDMEEILTHVTQDIQTVMFSATVPPFIRDIMKRFMKDPVNITIDKKQITAPKIDQWVVEVRDSLRTEAISRFMDVHNFKLGIVFCNTKIATESVARELQARGYTAEVLNGDLNQTQRDKVMSAFRGGGIDLLVATDVAARGIDVEDVDVIFNFEIPVDPEYYVHRIGRTGRAGRNGTSITFSSPTKFRRLKFIENQIKMKLIVKTMPSISDVKESRIATQLKEVREVLEAGGLRPYIEQLEPFAESGFSPIEIAAALLKLRADLKDLENREQAKVEKKANDGAMVTLKLDIGRQDNVKKGDLVGAIAGESGISSDQIGHINVLKYESFVDVVGDVAEKVIAAMSRSNVKGKKVRIVIEQQSEKSKQQSSGGYASNRGRSDDSDRSGGGSRRDYGSARGGRDGGSDRRSGGGGYPKKKRDY
jgi:ATP-dependent RNA helicase DeaD